MSTLRVLGLFIMTAAAEIFGCYSVFLFLRKRGSSFWLVGAALGLSAFAWLLSLHPSPPGRTYAAYGGVYVLTALAWLWAVDHKTPDRWDVLGALISVTGMMIIYFGPRGR